MDLQKMIDAFAAADRNTRGDYHVTLGSLIELAKSATGVVRFRDGGGPGREMSYRGYYSDLSFEPASPSKAADFVAQCEKALNATYEGYKGGDYTMGANTPLWRAPYSCCGDAIIDAAIEDGDLVLTCKRID